MSHCQRLSDSMRAWRIFGLLSGSNQSGKTFCAGIEFARIMRGMDPFNKREPGNLLTLVLGKDENHLGQTIWQKLFFPGAFYMLRDEETGLWRAVRPRGMIHSTLIRETKNAAVNGDQRRRCFQRKECS